VRGFVDLHCHCIAGVDDGAPTPEEGVRMLRRLHEIGFDRVIATPHMRPALFDNTKAGLTQAFRAMNLASASGLPEVELSCEHFFDDIVFGRLISGDGVPYPGDRAVLIEFPNDAFPVRIADRLFDLRVRRLRPVLAHPERYTPVRKDAAVLEPLLDAGVLMLMDVAALVGRHGRAARRAAEDMLEAGYCDAVSSDAHRLDDLEHVAKGIERLTQIVGADEAAELLRVTPLAILDGTIDS
jgi:protein-tyrosine phosphatase